MAVVDSDLELEVGFGSEPGEYTVRVIHAPAGGETSARFRLDVDAILAHLGDLENAVLASAVTGRRIISKTEEPLHEVGQQLFRALFAGAVSSTYRASLGAAQQEGHQLRVVLRLAAPELAALPWESLFDPDSESYLCQDMPLLRRIPAANFTPRPLEVTPPLRILGVVAAPYDLPRLDARVERQHLENALARPIAEGLVELVWTEEATWDGIQTTLLDGPWHVLHFIGHGDYDTVRQEGRIALLTATGRSDLVESSRLMHLLREAEPTPRLVVLNSCDSGQAGWEDLFAGTAAALVRGGISAVAAMQFTVSDAAAIAFSRGFYNAIAHNRDIDAAASSGRRSILGQNTLEWVTPVLYVRGGSTRLFTLTGDPTPLATAPEPPPGPSAITPPGASTGTQDRLLSLYIDARSALRTHDDASAIGYFDDLLALAPDYRDAASLRESALRRQERAEAYRAARTAEDRGDWTAAARGYARVQDDAAYPDAAARHEACAARQRVAELQDALRRHAEAGHWQGVLDTDAELAAIDPAAADPEGLAGRARLELLYAVARQAEEAGDWGAARHAYAQILTTDPDFRDAAERHDACRNTTRISGPRGLPDARAEADAQADASLPAETDRTGGPSAPADAPRTSSTGPLPGTEILVVRHGVSVHAVAFSPDGSRLATAGLDKTTRIWDTSTGSELRTLSVTGFSGAVHAVALSPDGARLASASLDRTARTWHTLSSRELLQIRHEKFVDAVAFSPDGRRLVTASGDFTARIWDATTGIELTHVRHDIDLYVLAVALSSDGSRLATGSGDNTARIWDTNTGAELLQVHHDKWVSAVAFSPDGTRLATGSGDNTARIWAV